jgi:hypothetical protein
MRVLNQTAAELVIQTSADQKEWLWPVSLLGVTAVGLVFAVSQSANPLFFLFLIGLGAFGLYLLYDNLQSETVTLDKTANEVRVDRKTPLGTQRWQVPLSSLQNVSVVTFKRRHKKADGNYETQWFYTLKFDTQDNQAKELRYHNDGDSVDAVYQAIQQFIGPLAAAGGGPDNHPPHESPPRMRISPNYQNWRDAIFNLDPSQAGVSENSPNQVYGVLMDVGMIDAASFGS